METDYLYKKNNQFNPDFKLLKAFMVLIICIIVFIVCDIIDANNKNRYNDYLIEERRHRELLNALKESNCSKSAPRRIKQIRRIAKDGKGNILAEEITEEETDDFDEYQDDEKYFLC